MADLLREAVYNWATLRSEWNSVRQTWRDSTTAYFERYFWDPLESEERAFTDELQALLVDLAAASEAARAYEEVPHPTRRR